MERDENTESMKAVEEFRDELINYAQNHGGYYNVIDAEDIKYVFDSLYPPEKPKLPKFQVIYHAYREGLEGNDELIVEAESVDEAISKVRDHCYSNYSTCDIKSVVKIS